jgi:hypothetical protein
MCIFSGFAASCGETSTAPAALHVKTSAAPAAEMKRRIISGFLKVVPAGEYSGRKA